MVIFIVGKIVLEVFNLVMIYLGIILLIILIICLLKNKLMNIGMIWEIV